MEETSSHVTVGLVLIVLEHVHQFGHRTNVQPGLTTIATCCRWPRNNINSRFLHTLLLSTPAQWICCTVACFEVHSFVTILFVHPAWSLRRPTLLDLHTSPALLEPLYTLHTPSFGPVTCLLPWWRQRDMVTQVVCHPGHPMLRVDSLQDICNCRNFWCWPKI